MNDNRPPGFPQIPPPPYRAPGHPSFGSGPAMPAPKRSGMALASLILGLLSIPAIFVCLGWLTALLAVIFGIIGIVTVSTSQGRITGKGMAWSGILAAVAAVAIYGVFLIRIADADANRPEAEKAAEKALQETVSRLSGKGPRGRGETGLEQQVAAEFSKTFKTMHEALIAREGVTEGEDATVKDQFVAVCDLSEKGCLIIAKVPEYKDHTDDAKETVATIAWMAANQVLSEHAGEAPQGSPLIVGLKGMALYGSIMTGEVGAEDPADTGTDKDVLEAFYLVEEAADGGAGE